jgi:hypothetical protein
MTAELDMMEFFITRPDGQERGALVGFGGDGTLWIQPQELDIDPAQAQARLKFPEPFLVMAPANGLVFIRADAATELIKSPEQRQLWQQMIEQLLNAYQRMCFYESARNN